MAYYVVRTLRPHDHPDCLIEADLLRRFERVVVFVQGEREVASLATEALASIRRFENRIDAETHLAGFPLAPGTAEPAARGAATAPPPALAPTPGPGRAPFRKLQAIPLADVLDLSKERVAVSPEPRIVEVPRIVLRDRSAPAPAGRPRAHVEERGTARPAGRTPAAGGPVEGVQARVEPPAAPRPRKP